MLPTASRMSCGDVGGMLLAERARALRDATLVAMSQLVVPTAAASCCFERGAPRRSARDGRSASASPIWRFGGALDFFRDFADVERITVPEIGLEERNLVLAPGLYIFVNAVRAPHPRGGVRIRRMGGYNT